MEPAEQMHTTFPLEKAGRVASSLPSVAALKNQSICGDSCPRFNDWPPPTFSFKKFHQTFIECLLVVDTLGYLEIAPVDKELTA